MFDRPSRRRPRAQSRELWLSCLVASVIVAAPPATAENIWSPVSEATITTTGDRLIVPAAYVTVAADVDRLRDALDRAPLESPDAWSAAAELSLPMPDGTLARFHVVESPIMAPELAAEFPEMRTYVAQGIDDRTATVRLDMTPHGFHAMILRAAGTVFIDPYQRGDVVHYVVYHRADARRVTSSWSCVLDATQDEIRAAEATRDGVSRIPSGSELRTYRTAVAATGEYTQFHGGTVTDGMNAIIVAINRVTGIYERDVAVRLELIPNNNLIVYTNPATDPYTNNDGFAMLSQNQSNLDSVIGAANYDIGHVFSTGGGGIASLGVVCVGGQKARGVTGLSSPVGDRFYVDYVAHEIGHQFNATHSFNGTAGSCGGGNRTAITAYEPGSGSTIMAYAGLCGSHNIQTYSDDYFNARSLDLIIIYTTNFSSCAAVTSTGNNAPVPDATPPIPFDAIPISTPFTLTGSATDPDGDELTYCWEEFDLGPGGHPDFPMDNAPIFRSFLPVTSPSRTFPAWSDIVNGTQTRGEILPSYARGLRFRLVARDNRADGGGSDFDLMSFDVDDTAGPFLVSAPNGGETLSSTVPHEITWDVAGTDNATVNCQSVDIRLSTDGGYTYPTTLLAGTANDGSELVTLPDIDTPDARVMVAAADNVFFDISDDDFTITTTVAVGDVSAGGGPHLLGNRPNPANPATVISFEVAEAGDASLRIYDSAGRLVAVLVDGFTEAGAHRVTWDGRDADGRRASPGVYFGRLRAGQVTSQRKMILTR